MIGARHLTIVCTAIVALTTVALCLTGVAAALDFASRGCAGIPLSGWGLTANCTDAATVALISLVCCAALLALTAHLSRKLRA